MKGLEKKHKTVSLQPCQRLCDAVQKHDGALGSIPTAASLNGHSENAG